MNPPEAIPPKHRTILDTSTPPPSAWANVARRVYRTYRNLALSPAHGLLRRALRAVVAQRQQITLRNGLRMVVDLDRTPQNTIFWLDGDVEPQLEWAVEELVPTGGTFVDCGANCGYIGLLARRRRLARVLFIEPHPRLAAAIRLNLDLNGWSNACQVVEAAASDEDGEAVLHESAHLDGSHSVLDNWVDDESSKQRIPIVTRTLPSILKSAPGFDHVDFLKIDTEGHDATVLRGLGEDLRPDRIAVVYVELGRDREEGFRRLEASGYTGFAARALSRKSIHRLRRETSGGPAPFFQPWKPPEQPPAETLWVGRGSALADLLSASAAIHRTRR